MKLNFRNVDYHDLFLNVLRIWVNKITEEFLTHQFIQFTIYAYAISLFGQENNKEPYHPST